MGVIDTRVTRDTREKESPRGQADAPLPARKAQTVRSPAQKLRTFNVSAAKFPSHLAGPGAGRGLALFLHWRWTVVRWLLVHDVGKTNVMPVIANFCGIVMRLLIDRTFGVHLHAFHGDSEMVVALNPLRVLQSDVPPWVHDWVLWWVTHHQSELLSDRKIDLNLATPISRQMSGQLVFAD